MPNGFSFADFDHSAASVEGPEVFAYNDLWQHPLPLLDYLQKYHGDKKLDQLGGSYGWSVRYRQIEDYEALGITRLGDYLDAYRAGAKRLPYLRHLSVNKAFPELRQYLRQPAQFLPNWADHPRLDRFSGPELFIGQAGTGFGNVHQDQVAVQWPQDPGRRPVLHRAPARWHQYPSSIPLRRSKPFLSHLQCPLLFASFFWIL